MGPDAMILVFWMLTFKPTFSLSCFTFIKRLFSSSSLSAKRVVSSAYLRLLICLPAILIPACASSSPAFLMMYFPVVTYGCESWTVKKAECRRIDAFELWCWRRLLGVPWIVRPFQVTQTIKNLPAIQDTCIWSLVRKIPWRREWQPHPVFLPWEFHGQRGLVGYSPLGHKELDNLSN